MLLAIYIAPVQIIVIVSIVFVMKLPIDWALPVTLLSIRQQLVDAKLLPPILACSSTASKFKQAGWA